jgi:hypothetical protein
VQEQEKRTYVTLWRDTADFRHSLMAMIIRAVLGLGAYLIGLRIFQQVLTGTEESWIGVQLLGALARPAGCSTTAAASTRWIAFRTYHHHWAMGVAEYTLGDATF